MAASVQELESEVLSLSPSERAHLLEVLLDSFEPDSEVEAAWVAEALRREVEVAEGKVQLVPGGAALERARARLG